MKPLKDYSHIRGIHLSHRPSFGSDFVDGKRETLSLEWQLEYCKKLNLNSARQFCDFPFYLADPKACVDFYVETTRTGMKYGVSNMQILFNGNSLDKNLFILEPEWWAEVGDRYVTDMVLALKDEPGLLMWDVMNEPSCNNYYSYATPEEKPERWEKINRFLKHYCDLIHELDPEGCVTIGHTTPADLEPNSEWVDVICFHDYSQTLARINRAYDRALAVGEKYGKPVINSETCCLCRANPYDLAIQTAMERNTGFYVFNLVSEGYWGEVHGLIYPDGTVRNPDAVAALYGFFRNRTSTRIKAKPNREGYVYQALKLLETALTDDTGLFRNTPRTTDEILEAAEYAANLMECNEMVPMIDPPSARIADWRAMPPEERNLEEVRKFAYELGKILKEYCQVL
ncbi:MAG: hypothetical protein E7458_06550 [Ruminococcaceae bacterium]|nr:hypothetical protein [Oscillospiraceae bacterium]